MSKKVFAGKSRVKVAVVQATSVFLNKEKTLEKVSDKVAEAARDGLDLVVFSESYVPCFPYWQQGYNDNSKDWFDVHVAFQDNAVYVPGADGKLLSDISRKNKVNLIIGCTEIDDLPGSRTLYNTLLYYDRSGELIGRHRKVMPTNQERSFYGMGGGGDNLKVYSTDIGRLGGLVCWENHMVLIKASMMCQGQELHIAVWPGTWSGVPLDNMTYVDKESKNPQTYNTCDIEPAIREYAFESQAFVISACGYQPSASIPDDFPYKSKTNWDWACGGSSIVDPFGCYLVEPVYNCEKIIIAELESDFIKAAKNGFDLMGHYSRPDLVQIIVTNRKD